MAARRRFGWGFVVLGGLALALVLWVVVHKSPPPPNRPSPTAVATAQASLQDLPVSITALGAAQAWKSDVIRAQVTGKLLAVDVTEGTGVRAGQRLAQIDPAAYAAALMQAQGILARDAALLENARLDLTRVRALAAQDSVSRQAADTQAAVVRQDEGVVMADQGAVAAAKVNLAYTRITAPITGRVGVRLVDPGNVVSPGDATGIVIVNQIEPIAVTFTVPQGEFQRLSDLSRGFTRPLAASALSQETGALLGAGELTIADNRVDPGTGTVALKARFPNADHHLWPGQFVNVRLTLQTLRGQVTIPATAVNQGPKGPFAYVLGVNGKVSVRPLTVGVIQGDVAAIAAGLRVGETVVTDGQLTLKPGAAAKTRPAPPAAPLGGPRP